MTLPSGADRDRLRSAAFRLKHDLGKRIRWSAPANEEESVASLRTRLRADLLETRRGPTGVLNAVEVFESWLSQEESAFRGTGQLEESLARIRDAVEEIRSRLPRLGELPESELRRLDDATRLLERETRRLWTDVVAVAGSAGGPHL